MVNAFLANDQKDVLFIPLVVKGYRTKIYQEKAVEKIQQQKKSEISSDSETEFEDVGESSSKEEPSDSLSFRERLVSYFRGFIHFLRGGSLESHIVLITVRKKEGGSYEVEYYDPKGRSISDLCKVAGKEADGSVSEHPITQYMDKIIARTGGGSPIYYHQGRLAADQSIFNRTECGFHVIRRALSVAKPDEKVDRNISSVAAAALKIINSEE